MNELIRVHADGTIEGELWKNLWDVEQENLKRYTARRDEEEAVFREMAAAQQRKQRGKKRKKTHRRAG